jgi:hypothetical protein
MEDYKCSECGAAIGYCDHSLETAASSYDLEKMIDGAVAKMESENIEPIKGYFCDFGDKGKFFRTINLTTGNITVKVDDSNI